MLSINHVTSWCIEDINPTPVQAVEAPANPPSDETCFFDSSPFAIRLYLTTVCFLYHSYALVKPVISLYNLTVSFLHQKTVAITWVIYIFLVCVFPSPSSDFSGKLKLLYYSPRVCQIPQQLQTHHPSLALCLRGNKVLGFPGWQICVIVLRPGCGNNSVDTGGEQRRKERREKGDARV